MTKVTDGRPVPRTALNSRLLGVAYGLALTLIAIGLAPEGVRAARDMATSDVGTKLVARADRANAAFMRGDMATWLREAGTIPADFTLMQPFGGPASHGFDASPARLARMANYFAGGRTSLEIAHIYTAPDMVVLAMIERQRARVGGLPDQDWSLRVTQVYRRRGETWELVHRHADPLVRHVGLDKAAALARGD